MKRAGSTRPDHLNEIGVYRRREIEARILAPLVEELGKHLGPEQVLQILHDVVVQLARQQGQQLAKTQGNTLADFAGSLAAWQQGDAVQLEFLEQSPECLSYNVTRCRYAELYQSLGVMELGRILSCSRDEPLLEGFNSRISFVRSQTILEGAPFCDFRLVLEPPKKERSGTRRPRPQP
jgi:hypothetical protein